MNPQLRRRVATGMAALLLTLALALALGSCAEKITLVDPASTPEGEASGAAQMVVWFEGETAVDLYEDRPPAGAVRDEFCGLLSPGPGDSFLVSLPFRRAPATQVRGMIMDGTHAGRYQLLRREAGGGFRAFQDFVIRPQRLWLSTQWELYRFTDDAPSDYVPPTYVGRGAVNGVITPDSPLTNHGTPTLSNVAEITYTGVCNPQDSLFTLQWNAVPGAARYWMHVFRFSLPPSPDQLIESSLPAPLNDVLSSDVFVGYVDTTHSAGAVVPPATSYRLGDTSRRDVRILLQRAFTFAPSQVRIAAVDTLGQLIAVSRGDYGLLTGEGIYALFRMRASTVSPRRPRASAAAPPSAGIEAVDRTGKYLRRH